MPGPGPGPGPDPDPENLASSNFVAVSGSSVVSDAEFHSVTAMTSCEPPADVDGGILAVGTSNPTTRARLRRMEGGGETEFDLEGHVFLMRLSDEVAREDEDGDSAKETIPVAATVRLYRPVACVAAGPAGMVIVAAGHETIVVRVQAGRKRKLEASLCATHVSRRPVLAVAASPISREIDDASDLRVAFALAIASRRDGVVLARVDAPSREPEWKDARVTHVTADATSRDAIALAMRRRGEVAGIDAEGRAFILQNRNDPRWLKQKRERETDEGEAASERVGEGSTGVTGRVAGTVVASAEAEIGRRRVVHDSRDSNRDDDDDDENDDRRKNKACGSDDVRRVGRNLWSRSDHRDEGGRRGGDARDFRGGTGRRFGRYRRGWRRIVSSRRS